MRDIQTDECPGSAGHYAATNQTKHPHILPESGPSVQDYEATAALLAQHGFTLDHVQPKRTPAFYRVASAKGAYSLRAWHAVLGVLASLGGRT